jgi:hypothetical protein
MPITGPQNAITFQSSKAEVARRTENFLRRPAQARGRPFQAMRQGAGRAPRPRAAAFCRAAMVRDTPKPCIDPINAINEINKSNLILFL